MTTEIMNGMDIPQLQLSNFRDTLTGKLDLNKYFQTIGNITVNITDESIKNEIWHRYIYQRKDKNHEFNEAYNEFFSSALDNTFTLEISKAFHVGEFYTTDKVKSKLRMLYQHEFAPDFFYNRTPKMTDLKKYNWFDFKYCKNENLQNGALILECLSRL